MADKASEVSWSPVITTAVIAGALFSFGLSYFLVMRSKHANHPVSPIFHIYEKRTIGKPHRSSPPWTGVGHGMFQWAKDALSVDDKELLRCVGLDTYMFLRFLLLGFWATVLPSICAFILIPINVTGGDSEGFNKITLGNLPPKSNRLWAAALVWHIFVPYVLWLLHKEWKHFFPLRSNYLARGDIDTPTCYRYAIIVENIPSKYHSSRALQDYFGKLFPGSVLRAVFCQYTCYLNELIGERMDIIKKYEIADAKIHAYPEKPIPQTNVGGKNMLYCSCGGKKVDAMHHYKEEIKRLNVEVDKERQMILKSLESSGVSEDVSACSEEEPNLVIMQAKVTNLVKKSLDRVVNTGFVIFSSLSVKQSAVQVELNGKFQNLDAYPAPDPNSIIWKNITRKRTDQVYLEAIWGAIWCVGVLFWAVIVGFVQSIANLDSVMAKLGVDNIDTTQVWYGIIAGYLPVIAFMLLMIILPKFISFIARNVVQLKSADECDSYTFSWHQMFQFANLWLIVIGGSLFNQFDTIFDDTGALLEILAAAIPGASVFFIDLILSKWGALGLNLSQVVEILVKWIMNKIRPDKAKPQRDLDNKLFSYPIEWGLEILSIVFIFLTSCVYLPIVPVILPFAALYFGTALVVYKHMCLHVYMQDSEGGGIIWFPLFNYIMVCIYMSSTTFIVYMGIKEQPIIAILGLIPLIEAIYMHLYIRKVYVKPLMNLSMEIAREIDVNEPIVDIELELYNQPSLRRDSDTREPLPYRRNAAGKTSSTPGLAEELTEEDEIEYIA